MNRKILVLSAFILLAVVFLTAEKPEYASSEEKDTIYKGVLIDNVDVGGMTKEQAVEAVQKFIDGITAKGVAITVGDNIVYATVGDMGYRADTDEVVNEALNIGRTGNLIKRYKDLKDVEQGELALTLQFNYDDSVIKDFVSKNVSVYNVAPINAAVAIKNGKLVYTDDVTGSKVNVKETAKLIENAFKSWDRQDIVIDAVVEKDVPAYTKDMVAKCNTIIGSYTTDYSSSAYGRSANLANGARLINNTVLYPGETFSAYKKLTPFTQKNGYKVAGAYLKGKVIDSVGGGACQVTTTLYNAVLQAELKVVERQNHSMTISYVDLSRDAAIAGTSKDFKFKNNTDTPILIQAFTQNKRITFKIWGNETRDLKTRKIKYVSVVVAKMNPPKDVITKDSTKPVTYRAVTTSAHVGYRAKLWKLVYENGVEVEKTLVNTSYYQPAARCVTIGTKKIKEDKDTDDTDTGQQKDTEKNTDTSGKTDSSTDNAKQDKTSQSNQTNTDTPVQGDNLDLE